MLLELPFPAHAVCNEQGVPVSLCLWPLWPPRYHFPRGHRAAGLQRAPGLSRSEQHRGELHTAPRGVLRAQVPGAPLAQTALPSGAEAPSFWLLIPSCLLPPASQASVMGSRHRAWRPHTTSACSQTREPLVWSSERHVGAVLS